jgi:HEAT repeat protein
MKSMRRWAVLVGVVALCGVIPVRVEACSCAVSTPKRAAENAAMVFAGVVTWKGERGLIPVEGTTYMREAPTKYGFAVEHVWKGEFLDSVEVSTSPTGGACGYRFEVGREYLVYSYARDDKQWTSICSATNRFEYAIAERYFLGPPAYSSAGSTFGVLSREDLFSMLSSPDPFVRMGAARGIGYDDAHRRANLARLAGMLDLEKANQASGVLSALKYLRSPDALPLVFQTLERGDGNQRQLALMAATSLTRGPALLPFIKLALRDPVPLVRISAAQDVIYLGWGRGETVDNDVLAGLIDLLGDSEAEARRTAAQVLEHYGAASREAVADLEVVRDYDPDPYVRLTARNAVIAISPEDAPLGTVKGQVIDATTGEPVPNAVADVARTRARARTDSTGAFVLLDVPAGEGELRVGASDYRWNRSSVTVYSGQTAWAYVILTKRKPGEPERRCR